jgi:hypothetical protein
VHESQLSFAASPSTRGRSPAATSPGPRRAPRALRLPPPRSPLPPSPPSLPSSSSRARARRAPGTAPRQAYDDGSWGVDETLYTTVIDTSKFTAEQIARAEAMAREIQRDSVTRKQPAARGGQAGRAGAALDPSVAQVRARARARAARGRAAGRRERVRVARPGRSRPRACVRARVRSPPVAWMAAIG